MKINVEPLTKIDQIQKNDLLLISNGNEVIEARAQMVKASEMDGVEVIYNKKLNKWFNVGMYLRGESWAKEVYVVRMG